MKKIIAALTLLISVVSFAQSKTTVGKLSPMCSFVAELYYRVNPADHTDTMYTFIFNNTNKRITSIESVCFSAANNALEQLYTAMKGLFLVEGKNEKERTRTFSLGENIVYISLLRTRRDAKVVFMKDHNHYLLITPGQLDKLFGKDKLTIKT